MLRRPAADRTGTPQPGEAKDRSDVALLAYPTRQRTGAGEHSDAQTRPYRIENEVAGMKISPHAKATAAAGLVLLGLVSLMLWFENRVSVNSPGVLLDGGALSEAQKQALTAMLDLVKLLTNWTIAVIGATGFFLKANVDKNLPITTFDLLLTFVIILLAILSLFLGHLVIDRTAEVLSLYQFPLNDARVRSLGRYQYLLGLAAISVFGLHIFQFFWARRT
jgi:hypothetical protein